MGVSSQGLVSRTYLSQAHIMLTGSPLEEKSFILEEGAISTKIWTWD